MKIIQGDRCSGKTTQAVKMAIETGSILVVRSQCLADNLQLQNPGLKAIPLLSFHKRNKTHNSYILDDVDTFFDPCEIVALITSGEVSKRLTQSKLRKKINKKRFFNGRQ